MISSLERQLRYEDYTIYSADSGKIGLDLLKKYNIGVVLSDQMMPEMDDVTFLETVVDVYDALIRPRSYKPAWQKYKAVAEMKKLSGKVFGPKDIGRISQGNLVHRELQMSIEHKHTILFVDDEVSITKALQRLFRKEGYHILTASSGQEGLELLKKVEEPVSLIVSDQRMPHMTGLQFLEKAKGVFPDAIRFLLTGYSDMNAIVDAVNKGEIHRYLTKPWNDDDLLIQVRQSLEQFELAMENRRLRVLTYKQNKGLN